MVPEVIQNKSENPEHDRNIRFCGGGAKRIGVQEAAVLTAGVPTAGVKKADVKDK